MREMYYKELPKWGKKGRGNEGKINWKESVNHKTKFIYNNIEGEITIIDYDSKTQKLIIQYLDKKPFEILTGGFQECRIGVMLGEKSTEFKITLGRIFKDNKRDLIILDRGHVMLIRGKKKDTTVSLGSLGGIF